MKKTSRALGAQRLLFFVPVEGLFYFFLPREAFIPRGDLLARWALFVSSLTQTNGVDLPGPGREADSYCEGFAASPQQLQMYQPECGSRAHSRLSMVA